MSISDLFYSQAHPSWHGVVKRETLERLDRNLRDEFEEHTIYPPKEDIFRVFSILPFNEVSVVILGQDPYINEGQAMGIAFSVRKGIRAPPTLSNIFHELSSKRPNDLTDLVEQGVLLLNTALTVRAGNSDSHKEYWVDFTSEIMTALIESDNYIIFALWGRKAAVYARQINRDKHSLTPLTSHPSPLSFRKTKTPFAGSRPFDKINMFRRLHGLEPIEWIPKKTEFP